MLSLRRRHGRDLDDELAVLTRHHHGVVHERRMQFLGRRLREGRTLAVRHSHSGFAGDRLTMHLDDGNVMKLALIWPRREAIAALLSIRWANQVGWIVQARTAAGECVELYAWRARVMPESAWLLG